MRSTHPRPPTLCLVVNGNERQHCGNRRVFNTLLRHTHRLAAFLLIRQSHLHVCLSVAELDQPKCPHNTDIKLKCVHTTVERCTHTHTVVQSVVTATPQTLQSFVFSWRKTESVEEKRKYESKASNIKLAGKKILIWASKDLQTSYSRSKSSVTLQKPSCLDAGTLKESVLFLGSSFVSVISNIMLIELFNICEHEKQETWWSFSQITWTRCFNIWAPDELQTPTTTL